MKGADACRIEESAWEAGPPPIPSFARSQAPAREAPSDAPESATRRRRSSADTVPASDPFSALNAGRPDWCVDLGESLATMTTFELWSAIERSDVAPWMRVWREGMECWTPVQELPELRWAVASAPLWAATAKDESARRAKEEPRAAVMLPPPPEADGRGERDARDESDRSAIAEDRSPVASEVAPRMISGSISPISSLEVTPAPVATETPASRPQAASSGLRWIVGGSMVAAAALGFAVIRSAAHVASPLPDARAPGAGAAEVAARPAQVAPKSAEARAKSADAAARAPYAIPGSAADEAVQGRSTALPAPTASASATDPALADRPPPVSPARRGDRGQQRLPRGGRRAQGR